MIYLTNDGPSTASGITGLDRSGKSDDPYNPHGYVKRKTYRHYMR
jgi:hypothetical protein